MSTCHRATRFLLGLSLILTVPFVAASIVGPSSTSLGKSVNLGGLEWLELTATENLLRSQVAADAGGFISAGWRYATRSETEALLDSLWAGTSEEQSADNFDGARWFFDHFGIGSALGAGLSPGYSSGGFRHGVCTLAKTLNAARSEQRVVLGRLF